MRNALLPAAEGFSEGKEFGLAETGQRRGLQNQGPGIENKDFTTSPVDFLLH